MVYKIQQWSLSLLCVMASCRSATFTFYQFNPPGKISGWGWSFPESTYSWFLEWTCGRKNQKPLFFLCLAFLPRPQIFTVPPGTFLVVDRPLQVVDQYPNIFENEIPGFLGSHDHDYGSFRHIACNQCDCVIVSSYMQGIWGDIWNTQWREVTQIQPVQGWAGKAFWHPGTGREIENHIPVLREGNGN